MSVRGVLFDLDGTLADTAPDLVAVLNRLLAELDRPPVPYAVARNEVSNGAVGLLRLGLGLEPGADVDKALWQRFLGLYETNLCVGSRLFIELRVISDAISRIGARWGIVTNKPAFLTEPLLARLGVGAAAGCVVSGDTLPERKPHPAPLVHAAGLLGVDHRRCIYVGDARRDIEAGRAAGMGTIAAAWGYIRATENLRDWGADAIMGHPGDVPGILGRLNASPSPT